VIIRLDGQVSLLKSTEWSDYIADTGITIKVLALDVYKQNGGAKRAGAVLIRKAAKLIVLRNLLKQL
jgi:hypothetical protein